MSKKRPRNYDAPPRLAPGGLQERPPRWWKRRVFNNTYTYRGRLVCVKGWSVKIQHEGHRRTLSLHSLRRAEAAREAAELYAKIVTRGWAAISHAPRRGRPGSPSRLRLADDGLPKTEVGYWQARLLRRRYPAAADQWTARIEHDGLNQYFPLGSAEPETAARKALAIYQTVRTDGWTTACEHFAREVTLAFHWVSNPVAWTYTTFHTETNAGLPKAAAQSPNDLRLLVVEPDRTVRTALQIWLAVQPRIGCVATFATVEEAVRAVRPRPNELWILNRALPGLDGPDWRERLKDLVPGFCGVLYSLYEDSDRLFLAAPGGASGYLLRRTPPDRMLEPVLAEASNKPLSAGELLTRVKRFFATMLAFGDDAEAASEMATLTAREQEILELLSKGYVDKEIATHVGISGWTVHGHVKSIFEKLGVHTRTEAAVKFLQK